MTKPTVPEHPDARYKVRIHLDSGIIHVITRTKPTILGFGDQGGPFIGAHLDTITDTTDGDTIGYLDWTHVHALTYRPVGE